MSVRLCGRSFVLKGGRNDHYSERKYRFCTGLRPAGCDGTRLSHRRKRRHYRGVSGAAGAICRSVCGGLWRLPDRPVLCGPAPPRAPVSHAGDGYGSAPAGLAECLRLPHGGPVCGAGLRPDGVPAAGGGIGVPRDHAGVYVFLPPHRRYPDFDERAGKSGDHRLCGQGEHGSQRRTRRVGGDHGGFHARNAAVAGCLSGSPAHQANSDTPVHPLLHE